MSNITGAAGRIRHFKMLGGIVNREIPEMMSLARIDDIEGNPSNEAQLKIMSFLELVETLNSAHTCATIKASAAGPGLAGKSKMMDTEYSLQSSTRTCFMICTFVKMRRDTAIVVAERHNILVASAIVCR